MTGDFLRVRKLSTVTFMYACKLNFERDREEEKLNCKFLNLEKGTKRLK